MVIIEIRIDLDKSTNAAERNELIWFHNMVFNENQNAALLLGGRLNMIIRSSVFEQVFEVMIGLQQHLYPKSCEQAPVCIIGCTELKFCRKNRFINVNLCLLIV